MKASPTYEISAYLLGFGRFGVLDLTFGFLSCTACEPSGTILLPSASVSIGTSPSASLAFASSPVDAAPASVVASGTGFFLGLGLALELRNGKTQSQEFQFTKFYSSLKTLLGQAFWGLFLIRS